jgi:hypothetical protein
MGAPGPHGGAPYVTPILRARRWDWEWSVGHLEEIPARGPRREEHAIPLAVAALPRAFAADGPGAVLVRFEI